MMSALKVLWSPNHPDKFITFGLDLRLYKVVPRKDHALSHPSAIPISSTSEAILLATNSENQYMKCVAWYPKPTPDHLLAVGQATGKVVLNSFNSTTDSLELTGREYVPKHPRSCNSLAWEPSDSSWLAAGLDKSRADNGILVWDVVKCLSQPSDISSTAYKPLYELGMSETTHSLAWLSPKNLICGMSNKHLKIFDLREEAKHQCTAPTKAVYEIGVDPNRDNRLASCTENQIAIWDVRNFEKPVVILTEQKLIHKIAWCPTRENLLSCLCKDSPSVKLFDIKQVSTGPDESEPAILERSIEPRPNMNGLVSFSWHPTHENRLLFVSSLSEFIDYKVQDRMTLNWASSSSLVWTHSKKTIFTVTDKTFLESLDDISTKMKARALQGYGIKSPYQNGQIVSDVPQLLSLWNWIELAKNDKLETGEAFQGILSLIEKGSPSIVNRTDRFPHYINEARDHALQLCGWGGCKDKAALEKLIERLQKVKQYTRAAALAVFNLDLRNAISILNEGSISLQTKKEKDEQHLHIVSMALAGYTPDKNSLWKEMCGSLKSQLSDPYIQAMFAFLTAENNYEEVLCNKHICIQDKIAFACLYLPDQKLLEYLQNLSTTLVAMGNLEAILLTGLHGDGLSLLQQYLDLTGDVQTVSAVVLHTIPTSPDPRPHTWVEDYRQLLDTWELWSHRCEFDLLWWKNRPRQHPDQQVFVSCSYCGQSVSTFHKLAHHPRSSTNFAPGGSFILGQHFLHHSSTASSMDSNGKVTCCPTCRKPMPRCSLCLGRMGTHSGLIWSRGHDGLRISDSQKIPAKKLAKVGMWFTWCQTCRHGGHADHLLDWFKFHSNCPVTSCTCKCMSLDGC